MRRFTLMLAVALAATVLVFAACGDKEGKKAEEPKAEEPKAEEPKAEEPKAEEPEAEEPKAEEPKAEEPKAEDKTPAPEESKAGYDLVKPLAEAAGYVPDGLVAMAVVDFSAVDNLAEALLPGGELLKMSQQKQKALEEELAAYHKKKLGFAVRQVDSAVLFVTATADVGILLKGVIEEAPDMDAEASITRRQSRCWRSGNRARLR